MGMLILLERLAVDYRKKSKIGFEIYPSPNISSIKLLFLCGHLKVDNLWAIKVTFLDRIRSFALKTRWGLLDRRYVKTVSQDTQGKAFGSSENGQETQSLSRWKTKFAFF